LPTECLINREKSPCPRNNYGALEGQEPYG
jgi:hypothetical protein